MLAVCAFTFSSCESLTEDRTEEATQTIEIRTILDNTKTSSNGLCTEWTESDEIHVWHKVSGSGDYIDDGRFIITDTESGTFSGTLASPLSSGCNYDWKLAYPYEEESVRAVQHGNNSRTHLCGALCPLEGTLENYPSNSQLSVMMYNKVAIAKFVVTNNLEHPMTVSTVSVGDDILRVEGSEPIAKGESAEFYLPLEPFHLAENAGIDIAVNSYAKNVKSELTFTAGKQKTINFNYNNPDRTIVDKEIWTSNRYSSFPDIIHYKDKYYCAFREAGGHVAEDYSMKGSLFILSSDDCNNWKKEEDLTISSDYDLRDPHFVESADGSKLFVYYGRVKPVGEAGYFPEEGGSGVSVFEIGGDGALKKVSDNVVDMKKPYYWLWSVTRHGNAYYGVAYYNIVNGSGYPRFMKSTDGIHFEKVYDMYINGNEASTTFIGDKAYVFFRSVSNENAYVSVADPPYDNWKTTTYDGMMMHCPISLELWDKIFVCMRGNTHGVPIYAYDPSNKAFDFVYDVFTNTSADRAYPGMIVYDDCLHIVYYAYKAVSQNIYYHRIPLEKLYMLLNGEPDIPSAPVDKDFSIASWTESDEILIL